MAGLPQILPLMEIPGSAFKRLEHALEVHHSFHFLLHLHSHMTSYHILLLLSVSVSRITGRQFHFVLPLLLWLFSCILTFYSGQQSGQPAINMVSR